jgi:hypothetical protein
MKDAEKGIENPAPESQADETKKQKFPAGPRYSLKTVSEPQNTGLKQKKNGFQTSTKDHLRIYPNKH